jgi:hypothetical protein
MLPPSSKVMKIRTLCPHPKENGVPKQDKGEKFHDIWVKYLEETSLHGLKYINEPREHICEKEGIFTDGSDN